MALPAHQYSQMANIHLSKEELALFRFMESKGTFTDNYSSFKDYTNAVMQYIKNTPHLAKLVRKYRKKIVRKMEAEGNKLNKTRGDYKPNLGKSSYPNSYDPYNSYYGASKSVDYSNSTYAEMEYRNAELEELQEQARAMEIERSKRSTAREQNLAKMRARKAMLRNSVDFVDIYDQYRHKKDWQEIESTYQKFKHGSITYHEMIKRLNSNATAPDLESHVYTKQEKDQTEKQNEPEVGDLRKKKPSRYSNGNLIIGNPYYHNHLIRDDPRELAIYMQNERNLRQNIPASDFSAIKK